ncbi:hypothetical protein GCM10020000_37540 [Streptomyces olivoverticillatus]
MATAESSDSMLATRVTVRTAAKIPSTGPSGSAGKASISHWGRETRGTSRVRPAPMATPSAASGAGSLRAHRPARPGRRGQAASTAMVIAPMSSAERIRMSEL